jgi:hypothetical protein
MLIFLCPFIRSCVSGLTLFCNGSDSECIRFCADLEKSAMETQAMIRQVSGEESMSGKQKAKTHQDQKGETGEE